ncbi:MAG: type II secretion system protein M [Proteobacteria bacterium]|nr:type II secretion system protein M [Pseudomonadota bacterium]
MMTRSEFIQKIGEFWKGRQPRERAFFVGAVAVVMILVGYTIVNTALTNIEKTVNATKEFRRALDFVADNQAVYIQNRKAKAEMREKLLSADTRIATKLSAMASALGFEVTVTPKDPHKTSDDSGAEAQEIEIQLKNVDYNKFLEYIVQINNLDTPIYIRHLNMNRTSNNSGTETKMTVSLTLISYRLREQPNAT